MKKNKYNKNRERVPHEIDTRVTVRAEECRGDAEKMVRKFSKKVKRSGIMDEMRDRRAFKKRSVLNTEKKDLKKFSRIKNLKIILG